MYIKYENKLYNEIIIKKSTENDSISPDPNGIYNVIIESKEKFGQIQNNKTVFKAFQPIELKQLSMIKKKVSIIIKFRKRCVKKQ